MTRGLGTRSSESPEFLSLILFYPDYLRDLMDLGERDAEARARNRRVHLRRERPQGVRRGGGRLTRLLA